MGSTILMFTGPNGTAAKKNPAPAPALQRGPFSRIGVQLLEETPKTESRVAEIMVKIATKEGWNALAGEMKEKPDGLELVTPFLADADLGIRLGAAFICRDVLKNGPQGWNAQFLVPALAAGLRDTDAGVRKHCAGALGHCAERGADIHPTEIMLKEMLANGDMEGGLEAQFALLAAARDREGVKSRSVLQELVLGLADAREHMQRGCKKVLRMAAASPECYKTAVEVLAIALIRYEPSVAKKASEILTDAVTDTESPLEAVREIVRMLGCPNETKSAKVKGAIMDAVRTCGRRARERVKAELLEFERDERRCRAVFAKRAVVELRQVLESVEAREGGRGARL